MSISTHSLKSVLQALMVLLQIEEGQDQRRQGEQNESRILYYPLCFKRQSNGRVLILVKEKQSILMEAMKKSNDH